MNSLVKYGVAACAFTAAFAMHAETVTMKTPENFQVLSLSPNGKWACGVFVDAVGTGFGFRWNLESGSIEMLGSGASTAWDIANDGTVSGDFGDTEALESGASISMPGFWRDGAWHHLEMPQGKLEDGFGCGISPDGQYMVGAICIDGIYNSYIWKNGMIHRALEGANHQIAYAVSPDGNSAAGWSMQYNRVATFWDADGSPHFFTDGPNSFSPWNYFRNFSPDGNKLVYWGGWDPEGDDNYLYCIFDRATGQHIRIPAPAIESDLEFFDISNSGLLVGYDRGRGYVWTGSEGMYVDDYFASRGVDLSGFDDFYGGTDYYVGQLPIFRIVAVSEDENVFLMNYYDTIGEMCSMAVKIDQDLSAVAPAEVSASQLSGLSTVQLKWKRPVGANSLRGYNIYRNGKKINGFLPVNALCFYDKNLAPGKYSYEVSAVSTTGVETRAEALEFEVKALCGESPFAPFARRKGVNNALLSWSAPLAPGAHKRYHDLGFTDFEGFAIYQPLDVEMAVAFDKAEISNYAGYRLHDVSFVPMSPQASWKVNVYTRDASGQLALLASQPVDASALRYRELNTVSFSSPVEVPAGDLIVAVEVNTIEESYEVIGAQPGKMCAGYSDLLRQVSDPDFFSVFESSAESGMSISALCWAIDVNLQPADASAAAVIGYDIYLGDEKAGSAAGTEFLAEALADGKYTFGIEAVYDGGIVSDRVYTSLDMKARYIPVSGVTVDAGTDGSTVISASWTAPADNDLTSISYTSAKVHSSGLRGLESSGYALMAANEYPSAMFRGYDGYRINSFRFYPLADALFTFLLFENDELVYEYEVPEFEIGKWNEIAVPDELFINANSTYRLVLDCFDPEPDVPLVALDNDMPRPNYSDLYSIDNGITWNSATIEAATHGNWMLDMTIVDTVSNPVAVDGYDVVVDGSVANGAMLKDTSFTHDFGKWDDREHTLAVNVYYPTRSEAVEGEAVCFHLSVSGIADGCVADIVLNRTNGWLVADGDDVCGMEVYSPSGELAAASDSNKVNISSLSAGIYVVRILTPAGQAIRKVNIIK